MPDLSTNDPPGHPWERAFAELRRDIFERLSGMEGEIRAAAAIAGAAQAQVISHAAVCEERQRQVELRRAERDRWDQERNAELRAFMVKSNIEREAIRIEIRNWAIRSLLAVLLGTLTIVGAFVTAGGLKLFGH